LTKAHFARAGSRAAVDQTGAGAFLDLARLPSATGDVIQSVVEQKRNTIVAAPAAEAILQGLNPAQQRAYTCTETAVSISIKAGECHE